MTRLDRAWVQRIKNDVSEDIEALALEVERLEGIVAKAYRIIKEGKARFAPSTTNSEVDDFLAEHGP